MKLVVLIPKNVLRHKTRTLFTFLDKNFQVGFDMLEERGRPKIADERRREVKLGVFFLGLLPTMGFDLFGEQSCGDYGFDQERVRKPFIAYFSKMYFHQMAPEVW